MSLLERFQREAGFLRIMVKTGLALRRFPVDGPGNAADLVEEWARRRPEAPAIFFEDRIVHYGELEAAANRYAHWAQLQGVGRGDVVAIFMDNRPEYLFAWLGLAKLGAVGALINTNLRDKPLAHTLRLADARVHIVGAELTEPHAAAVSELETKPAVWVAGGAAAGAAELDPVLAAQPTTPPGSEARKGHTARDLLFYIYTSGTTGLPKAARISHHRFLTVASAFAAATEAQPADRMYVVLPLYHTAGGVCAVGAALSSGAAVVLRQRFSASRFWEDCRRYHVTLFQYIGELCRYLLNSPEQPDERTHHVRLCVGNGLRPDVWQPFQQRFGIPKIVEFYGATEGNVALTNLDGKPGAVGRIPWYLERFMSIKLIRFDVEAEAPVRSADGFCVECLPGEAGEAIGRIPSDPSAPIGRFEGYTSKEATEKKILRDVFERGDAWFRSGDLLRRDAEGYFYFVDRIGDTFRWKGENVATSEVSEVISAVPGVTEANVYGVHVPGADGRAGMAALVVGDGFDLDALYAHLEKALPVYARPLFLRLRPELEITGTFKHRKVDLVRDGFDPETVKEPIYFADPEQRSFVPLDDELFTRIREGKLRL